MKSIIQKLIKTRINNDLSCEDYYDKLIENDIDYIVKNKSIYAAKYLNHHPFFKEKHVDFLTENIPCTAVQYLHQNPLFKERHIDYIIERGLLDRCSIPSPKSPFK